MNDILRSYGFYVNLFGVVRVRCPDPDCNELVVPHGKRGYLGSIGDLLDSAQQHQQEYHTNG